MPNCKINLISTIHQFLPQVLSSSSSDKSSFDNDNFAPIFSLLSCRCQGLGFMILGTCFITECQLFVYIYSCQSIPQVNTLFCSYLDLCMQHLLIPFTLYLQITLIKRSNHGWYVASFLFLLHYIYSFLLIYMSVVTCDWKF